MPMTKKQNEEMLEQMRTLSSVAQKSLGGIATLDPIKSYKLTSNDLATIFEKVIEMNDVLDTLNEWQQRLAVALLITITRGGGGVPIY